MIEVKDIKSGYQLQVTTWENDADHYKTKVIDGLIEEDVKFLVWISQHFNSQNDPKKKGLGNGSVDGDALCKLFSDAMDLFPEISADLTQACSECCEEADFAYDFLTEKLLGYTEEYGDELYFCRVVSDIKVYFIPADLHDISERFVK